MEEKLVVFTKDAINEEALHYARRKMEEATKISVIYNPDCGCEVDQFYALDRFPMSPVILATCPECKKFCHMEISEPITFHCKLSDTDISLEDLQDAVITESNQSNYLKAYQALGSLIQPNNE